MANSLINGLVYAKSKINHDFRSTRIAVRTATGDNEAVPLIQLTQQLQSISNNLEQQLSEESASRTSELADINSLINSNYNTMIDLYQGVRRSITVAARVTDIAELNAPIPGIDYLATIDSYERWVLVDSAIESDNGIYFQTPTGVPDTYTATRLDEWQTAEDFPAGVQVFVDKGTYENSVYWVFDGAVDDGNGGFSVSFTPWQRPEFIAIDTNTDSTFLTKIGNKIRAEIDETYLQVTNGELSWSGALTAWKSSIDVAIADLNATIAAHTTELAEHDSAIDTHTSQINTLTTSVTTLQSDAGDLRTDVDAASAANTAQDTLITGLRTDVDAATTKNVEQDGRLTTLETSATNADNRLTSLETADSAQDILVTGLRTDVDAATAKNVEQDGRLNLIEASDTEQAGLIADLRTDVNSAIATNTTQDGRLTAVEGENAVQNTRLTNLETVDTEQAGLIADLQSEVDGAIAANTTQDGRLTAIETLNTTQDGRLTAIETVNTTQDGRLSDLEAADSAQDTLITGLRTDVDTATATNTTQDGRLTTLESSSTNLQTQIDNITSNSSTQILSFLQASSIRRVLSNGSTIEVEGFYETSFNIDVTSEMATLGAGAAFRVVALNDAALPYTQSSDIIATYPDANTVTLMFHSSTGAAPDNTIEASLHAFFA